MHPNYEYFLNHSLGRGKVLDYGCGMGLCVEEGLRRGIDIWGADIFEWDEDITGEEYHGKLPEHLLGKVLEIQLETLALPYPDAHFDFVYCNMVFEHVENIDRALSEIARVLKPDGQFFAAFPGKESVVEAHVRIPFIHWIPKNASFRMWYMTMMRRLRLGAGGEGNEPREWAELQLKYLDQYTFYRTRREIAEAYASAGFNIKNIEEDYLGFRMKSLAKVFSTVSFFARVLSRALGVQVIAATKKNRERYFYSSSESIKILTHLR